MAGKRRYRSTRGRPAKYLWFTTQIANFTVVNAGVSAVLDLLDLSNLPQGVDTGNSSVVRAIINLQVGPVAFSTVAEWYFAMAVMTRAAYSSGAIPNPVLDSANYYINSGDAYEVDNVAGQRHLRKSYDLRTARKIPSPEHTMTSILTNSGTVQLEYFVSHRLLLKLN